MAAIGRNFGAQIIKNVGDCLILCYPRTSDASNKSAFNDVLECITMIESRNTINQVMSLLFQMMKVICKRQGLRSDRSERSVVRGNVTATAV
jgi:hypothetical protein